MSDRIRRSRPLPWVGRVFLGLVCLGVVGWMALAIYFDLAAAWPMWLRAGLAVFVPVAALVALLLVRPRWRAFAGIAAAFVVVVAAWLAIPPPTPATGNAPLRRHHVTVHNVRNAEYRSEEVERDHRGLYSRMRRA